MKINEYYRDTAHMHLNGSIAALIPAIVIVVGNLSVIKHKEVMLLTIPFLIYSLISFQVYLFRIKQSIEIKQKMIDSKRISKSLFEAQHLLVLYRNTQDSCLFLYFPDGHLAGKIKKVRGSGFRILKAVKTFALYNAEDQIRGVFILKGRKVLKIEVYDRNRNFLGCFEKKMIGFRKAKKELIDQSGRYLGMVEGSTAFMDEQVCDQVNREVGRLRRGWMPMEWSPLFPEPNTPVLSIKEDLSEEDKLLRMSFLINEYFIER